MGFMTEISILNDRWDEIRKNPASFVEQIYIASITGSPYEYVVGQTTVAKSHHADDIRVYFSGRNCFFDAFPSRDMETDRLNKHLKYLKEIKRYLKISEEETKQAITLREKQNEVKQVTRPKI